MKLRIFATLLLALFTFVLPAAAGVRSAPHETNAPPPVAATPGKSAYGAAPSHGSRADQKRYAGREAASKNAKKFRGGEPVVVITATAAIIILLGVIIILLVT